MSKYAVAKDVLTHTVSLADSAGLDPVDVQEALLILLVQALKEGRGAEYMRGILQYEADSLGSGGVHDLPRGGGHS